MAVDQVKFLAALNNPDIIQRWRLRAILKASGTDPDMTGPLFRQFIAVGAATNATEATALSTGCPVTMMAKATAVANGLVANEGLPATATTGPIITEILALIQQFLPMLISCIPAIA